ncbi:hypothetical protein EMIHUDRAFT_217281 [Emiliania huxleyi CCMP1516]|uniref:HTTM-like domain-containing protein n=2 Tax=Emiliania huxleyi TaxID=2903 RepID=A0A0D3IBD9_EMIH1|nr:hypothetical protein EMIHUDRAFT_217281 [Emiliania huxleyi CCMP1516]EOD08574.1 hypothetical protein EMIHUDRAFT_217281 [Emiliania huxleyi CCMP1516]|eukprot:XP_005761003.1 hypothetical protein EMIHUDRAFT_217281 [Emiliania huxleyi CCMP1516]
MGATRLDVDESQPLIGHGSPGERRRWLRAAFGIDPRSLALFRSAVGLLVGLDVLLRVTVEDIRLLTDEMAPRSEARSMLQTPSLSVYMLNGSRAFVLTVAAVHVLAACCLAAGWHARASAVVVWGLQVSVVDRLPVANNGGDLVLLALLLWACLLPCGELYTLQHRDAGPSTLGPARTSSRRASSAPRPSPTQGAADAVVLSWASAGLATFVPAVYFDAGWNKVRGGEWALMGWRPDWWPGGGGEGDGGLGVDAVALTLCDEPNLALLGRLARGPLLQRPLATALMTTFALALELLGPLCLFAVPCATWLARARLLLVPLFLLFNLGLAALYDLLLFPAVMAVGRFKWTLVLASAFAFVLFWSCLCGFAMDVMRVDLPGGGRIQHLLQLLHVRTEWHMYDTQNGDTNGWEEIEGTLRDGSSVDVLRSLKAGTPLPRALQPTALSSDPWQHHTLADMLLHHTNRWRERWFYQQHEARQLSPAVGRHLCERWARAVRRERWTSGQQLERFVFNVTILRVAGINAAAGECLFSRVSTVIDAGDERGAGFRPLEH